MKSKIFILVMNLITIFSMKFAIAGNGELFLRRFDDVNFYIPNENKSNTISTTANWKISKRSNTYAFIPNQTSGVPEVFSGEWIHQFFMNAEKSPNWS